MSRFHRTAVSTAVQAATCTATNTVTNRASVATITGGLLAILCAPAAAVTFTWNSGNFVPGPGVGTTAPSPLIAGDVLNIQTAAAKTFAGVSFVNAGTVNWANTSGSVGLQSLASVTNTGLWDAQGDASLAYGGGAASTFTNSGTLRKSGGSGTTQIGNSTAVAVVNNGTVDAQVGTIVFGGDNTFSAGTVFTGAGNVVVNTSSAFNGAFTASNLTLAAGTQIGNTAVLNGQAQWTGGVLAGSWQVAAGATLNVAGASTKTLAGADVVNNGTLAWQAGTISLQSTSKLTNNGVLDAQSDATLAYGGGAASTFTNSGTLRKSGGSGTTQIGNSTAVAVVNNGTVDAQVGTIVFGGDNTFNAGTVFTGAGNVVVNTSSAFNGSFMASNLTLAAGTQVGNSAVLNGQVQWTGGVLAGSWQVAAGATLNVAGASTKTLAGTSVVNNGALAWQGGTISMQSAANLTNDGVLNAQSDATLAYGGGSASTFTNSGTLRKSGGSGTTQIGNSTAVAVVNNGTVDAQVGTIVFGGDNTFNAGTVFTGAGNVVVNTSSTFNGAFTASNLTLASGTQTGSAAALNGQAKWAGGALAGNWQVAAGATLNVASASTKTLAGASVVNNGTLVWQAGTISMQSTASLTNNGVIDAQANDTLAYGGGTASAFTNNGVVRKTAGSGTTVLSNSTALAVVNNGTIDVQVGTIQLPTSFVNDGTLTGSGTLQTGGVLTNNGTLAPGSFGVGTLALTGGALAQTTSATFAVDLTSMSAFDLLTAAGAASLNGTLALSCFAACSFSVGDTFTILNATGPLTGTFAGVTLAGFATGAFNVIYDTANSDVRLLVTENVTAAVPEPSTYALLLAGLALVGGAARKRQNVAASAQS